MEEEVVVGLVIFLIGIVIVLPVIIIAWYRKAFRQREDAVKTTAYVVENVHQWGSSYSYPVIEFVAEDGVKHRYQSKVGTSPPRVRAGTYVPIYYLRSNPQKFQIKAGWVIYFLAIFLIIFGSVLSSIGVMFMIFGKSG